MPRQSPSVEIFERARKFVAGKSELDELYTWVFDQEPFWGSTSDKEAAFLANGILLASWEHYDGYRDEASVREFIARDLRELTSKRSSTKD